MLDRSHKATSQLPVTALVLLVDAVQCFCHPEPVRKHLQDAWGSVLRSTPNWHQGLILCDLKALQSQPSRPHDTETHLFLLNNINGLVTG